MVLQETWDRISLGSYGQASDELVPDATDYPVGFYHGIYVAT